MKIAVIVPEFPCISETFILNQITALLDAGHQVTIIALKENPADKIHENVIEYKLIENTKYLKIASAGKTKKRFSALLKAAYYGFRFPVPLFKAVKSLLGNREDFYINLYFLFLVIDQKFEVFHFHFGNSGKLGVFLTKVGLPGKMITSFHGYDINQIPLQKGEDYYKELFETGGHFIANSEFTRRQMIRYGCPEEKISIIPVGLRIEEYPYKQRHFPTEGPIEILTVGRLVEKKGCQYSIQAIAELIHQGFNIH
jgi:colanic acid/amylovoran biosynthesis glycosyltransferase